MDTNISPSEYFNWLLFFNGIKDVLYSFYNNKDLLDKGFLFMGHDSYLKTDLIEDESHSFFLDEEITKDSFFVREIKEIRLKWFQQLTTPKLDISPELNYIKIYYKKAITEESNYHVYIAKQLYQLISDLRLFFPKLSHPAFNILNTPGEGASYFQYKELSPKFFEELYTASITLDLLDDVDTTEEMFYDVFTCIKPNDDLKLVFIKPNPIVAYFLKQIEVFFNNFNAVTIEKSGCFFNKQGKIIKSTDLYTALSRGNFKNNDYYKKIDSQIISLKKQLKD